ARCPCDVVSIALLIRRSSVRARRAPQTRRWWRCAPPLVLSHPAQYQYRNEVPQHQHRDLPSSRVVCHSSVLSDQDSCGCAKFGTKRPQVQILSPRPSPQVSDLRECRASVACVPLQPSSRRPEGTKKEHEGTPGKAGADFDRQKNTRPPRTAQQTPRHSRD